MSTLWDEFLKCAKSRGPEPLVTWIGEAGRVELSVTTYMNAVSKAANFLIDGLMLDENAKIRIQLGNHWQSPVWSAAALVAGIGLTDQNTATVTFAPKLMCEKWSGSSESLVIVSQDPFGMPDKDISESFVNASAEVRMFGDYFAPMEIPDPMSAAITTGAGFVSFSELSQQANKFTAENSLDLGLRYLLKGSGDIKAMVMLQTLIPILNKSSVVLYDLHSQGELDVVLETERASKVIELSTF